MAARQLLGALLSVAFGAALASVEVPLAWMLGALAGGAMAASFSTMPPGTRGIRRAGQLLIGAAAAGALTPDTPQQITAMLPLMRAAELLANMSGILLARLARVDRTTALLASLPAGMAEMTLLAKDLGARGEVVAVVHMLRVVQVVVLVPLLVNLAPGESLTEIRAESSIAALLVCLGGGWLVPQGASQVGFLNPYVVAPMILGALLVAWGIPVAPLPTAGLVLAPLLIGHELGLRLRADLLARLPRAALAGPACSLVLTLVMVQGAAPAIAALGGLAPGAVALGVAPGGLGEMIAAAKSSGASVGLVAEFQILRSVLTNMVVPQVILPRR